MSRSQKFRDQHDTLLEMVSLIKKELSIGDIGNDATEVRQLWFVFMGKLTAHLALEDISLYPSLKKHGDEKIKTMAKQFSDEMGFIADAAVAHNSDWITVTKIQENPAGFIEATENLFEVLEKRIQKENDELYVALDRLEV